MTAPTSAPNGFAPGDKVDARITNVDRSSRKIGVSIKALEISEEKEAMAQYGSPDSGASLGDILGAAMKTQAEQASDKPDAKEPAAEEPAAEEPAAEEPAAEEPAAGEPAGEEPAGDSESAAEAGDDTAKS